jgi:cytochrome bd-type quinol oxidase subunit 2
LLVGIILSALTFSAKTNTLSFEGFLNVYFGVGILLLVSSTATAGLTYTVSDSRVGMGKSDFQTLLDENLSSDELRLVLTKSYAKWIRDNQSTEILNSFYSTSTILLLIYAVAYLALGTYDALVERVPLLLEGFSNVALLLVTLASGYPSQIKRVLRELDFRIG